MRCLEEKGSIVAENSHLEGIGLDRPLVSVVIPAYNHEDYVEKAIESVMNQTYPHVELIVINDGSIDETDQSIVRSRTRFNDQFAYVSRANRGLIATLNEGLALCSGKYIQTLASDDCLLPDKIEQQVAFLEANPEFKMVYGPRLEIDSSGRVIRRTRSHAHFKGGAIFEEVFTGRIGIPPLTVLAHTSVVREYGFAPESGLEDWVLYSKIAHKYLIGYLPICLAMYRLHGTNTSKNVAYMRREKQRALTHLLSELDVREVTLNNYYYVMYTQTGYYGVLRSKIGFLKALSLRCTGLMTVPITSRAVLRFLIKWW